MRTPLLVRPLSSGQVAALEARYRRMPVPVERTCCHIVLLSHQGLLESDSEAFYQRRARHSERILRMLGSPFRTRVFRRRIHVT